MKRQIELLVATKCKGKWWHWQVLGRSGEFSDFPALVAWKQEFRDIAAMVLTDGPRVTQRCRWTRPRGTSGARALLRRLLPRPTLEAIAAAMSLGRRSWRSVLR